MNGHPTGPLPVYVSFSTFQAAIQSLREHGLPVKLDRSAWASRSGTEQGQIISALKFLGMIDSEGNTQSALRSLVDCQSGGADEKRLLGDILRRCYQPVFDLDLATVTPRQLTEAIGEYGVSGATKDRAVRFFIRAALYCGIQISSRMTSKMKSRAPQSEALEALPGPDGASLARKVGRPRGRRPKAAPVIVGDPAASGSMSTASPMKTIQLPKVGGTLSVTGTFNPFYLVGEERALVYQIIDAMTEYEERVSAGSAP